ncbi:alpha/beta fold hydrolase [Mycobacterium avium]|uniref:alpha/beta fold hydrolase n=1 Tax=Mycobacterium avium TaxID=1764 RepID=UPI0009FDEF3A|nr:alpha/beta hydrolase [Mycobacterium avium]
MPTHVTPAAGIRDQKCRAARKPDRRRRCIERTVTTSDGVQLAVSDYLPPGDIDHTIVLLHGWCLTQTCWHNQIRHLRRQAGCNVRIISYDHRGHGRSAGAPIRSYRIDRLAADLAELLADLNVTSPLTLAGHSLGGMVALSYLARPAHQQPARPDGLVLIATAAGRLAERGLGRLLTTPGLDALVELIDHAPHRAAEHTVRTLARPLCAALARRGGYATPERHTLAATVADAVHHTPWTTAIGFLPALKNYDQHATLGTIAAATTVISGGADTITPAVHAYELAAGIPNATHLHQPTAGHMLLHEAPHVVTAAINRTIAGHQPDRPTGPLIAEAS